MHKEDMFRKVSYFYIVVRPPCDVAAVVVCGCESNRDEVQPPHTFKRFTRT